MKLLLRRLLSGSCLLLVSAALTHAHASFERSGSWYDPARDGEGFVVQFIDDTSALVYWFTYDEAGNQRWFVGAGDMLENQLIITDLLITSGGVFGPGFDPNAVVRTSVGNLTLTFDDDSSGAADYMINGIAGQQMLTRLTRPVEVVSDADQFVPRKSGSWFDPTRDGEGLVIEILPDDQQLVYWFTYDIDGNQAWMLSLGPGAASQGSFSLDMLKPTGGRFGPDFDPADVVRDPAGAVRVSLQCEGGYGDFISTDPDTFADIGFNLRQIVGIGPNSCQDNALTNLYPQINGAVTVPDHATGQQLRWLLDRLADDKPFTDQMISERFSSQWLDQNPIDATRATLEGARSNYPSASLTDPVAMASTSMTGVFTGTNRRAAYFQLAASLTDGKITNLRVFDYGGGNGSLVSAGDRSLNFEQVGTRLTELADQSSMVVARIDSNNQCQAVAGLNENTPRSTASVFKIWILAGVADALDDRALFHDQIVPLDGSRKVRGSALFFQPDGLELSIDELSTLMMGISDNTATDMLLDRAGRDRIDALHAEYGHSMPELMTPQLGISEQFHLFFSFPFAEAMSYVNGTEQFRRDFLTNRIIPLGSAETGGGGFFNESLFIDGAWRASPMDVCGAFARHRLHEPGSDAALLVDRALQVSVAQPFIRKRWDRIWYKGGNLESGANGQLVLTHAFMLEREGERPLAVIGMANNTTGNIDGFALQSIMARLLELADGL